jgi:hypothetical protein
MYLRAAYRLDWSPIALEKARRKQEIAEAQGKDDDDTVDPEHTEKSTGKAVAPMFKHKVCDHIFCLRCFV